MPPDAIRGGASGEIARAGFPVGAAVGFCPLGGGCERRGRSLRPRAASSGGDGGGGAGRGGGSARRGGPRGAGRGGRRARRITGGGRRGLGRRAEVGDEVARERVAEPGRRQRIPLLVVS